VKELGYCDARSTNAIKVLNISIVRMKKFWLGVFAATAGIQQQELHGN
jgi:hypothetical protein